MAIATFSAFCLIEQLYRLEGHLLMTRYHHLCNTLTIIDDERLLRQVDKQHPYLSTVISIDSTGTVEDSDTLL